MNVLFAPHADDETLFAAFTLIEHRPRVIVCFGSVRDYGDSYTRMQETRAAEAVLTGGSPTAVLWHAEDGDCDLVATMRAFDREQAPARVWAPSRQSSHVDHVAVAEAAARVFGSRVTAYHTYVDGEKVRAGVEVVPQPGWITRKLRALACYQTQIDHPRARQFFLADLREYQEAP